MGIIDTFKDLFKAQQQAQIGSYQRRDPRTGKMIQVGSYSAGREKGVTEVSAGKASSTISPDQGSKQPKLGVPITGSKAKPGVPKPSQKKAEKALLEETDFQALPDTASKVAAIKTMGSDSQHLAQPITQSFVLGDTKGEILKTYIKEIAKEPKILNDFYRQVEEWDNKFNIEFTLPSGEQSPSGSARRETKARFGLIKTQIAYSANLEGLKKMSKEGNIYVQEAINKNMTKEIIKSGTTADSTKQTLETLKRYLGEEKFNTDSIQEDLKYFLKDMGMEEINKGVIKGIDKDPHSKEGLALNAAVNKHIFHKSYEPIGVEAKSGISKVQADDTAKMQEGERPSDINQSADMMGDYIHTLGAAAREFYNRRGVKTLTLYKAMKLDKKHPLLRQIKKGSTYDHTEEPVSVWSHDPKIASSMAKGDGESIIIQSEVPVNNFLSTYKENSEMRNQEGQYLIMTDGSRKATLYKED